MNRILLLVCLTIGVGAGADMAAAQQAYGRGGMVFQAPNGGEIRGNFPDRGESGRVRPPVDIERRADGAERRIDRRAPNSLGADWREQQDEARTAVRHGQFASLERVIDSLERLSPGRQLDAGIEDLNGRPVYRVRWMTIHGRRIDFLVDAASGAVLAQR